MKNTRLARVASTVSITVALTGLAACGSSSDDSAKGGLDLVKAGTLTVCSDVAYPPFEDFDKTRALGFKGFDVDIIQKVATSLHLKLTIKDSDFNALKSGLALKTKQCDLIASAMSINPEREAVMDFSAPYFDADQSLLVPDGSPIKSLADLKGKKLGVQSGTTGEEYAKAHAPGAKIVALPDDGTEFQALKSGQIDAILQDLGPNQVHADAGGYTVLETYKTEDKYGFAVSKGNTKLASSVSDALDDLKADGDYQKIYDTYFPKTK